MRNVVRNGFLHFEEEPFAVKLQQRSSSSPPLFRRQEEEAAAMTTVMVRNVPTRFTAVGFFKVLDSAGFANTYSFFYLPMDFRSGKNMGYCFIDFATPEIAHSFTKAFDGTRLDGSIRTWSRKVLRVTLSSRQGLKNNVALFKDSELLYSTSLPLFKPFVRLNGFLHPLSQYLFDLVMNDVSFNVSNAMTVLTLRYPKTPAEKPGLLPTPDAAASPFLKMHKSKTDEIIEAKSIGTRPNPLEAKGVVCLSHGVSQDFLRTCFIPTTIRIHSQLVKAEMRNSFLSFELVKKDVDRRIMRRGSCPDFSLLDCESPPPSPPPPPPGAITTYMIRNIPTRFTSITFVRLMEEYGFGNSFNFFYLPMDFRSGKNMGYAFINFIDPAVGSKFVNRFNQRRLPVTTSKKVLEISPSRRQGLAENIALFRTSDLLNSVSLPHYKPLIATKETCGSLVPLTETNFPPLGK